ncbi:MAG: GerMN domain-containing protein [Lachnospiraceae bacterium]|nr:GerMN domain-containing protein [Lachnospiraceae bacterium]
MNKIKISKINILWLYVLLFALFCPACGRQEQPDTGVVYNIHYVNNEETKTLTREYTSETKDPEALLGELFAQLKKIPSKLEYEAPLSNGFNLLGYTLDNGQLTLNFDEHYKDMDTTKEVLVRAAIVRTVTQVPEISYVSFTVQGELLADSSGNAIGTMSKDTFIDNAGNEINAYEKVNLRLYFATEDGTGLVEESRRNVVYSSNISLEKLVVEKLIEGPMSEGAYPVVNPTTKIVSVTTKDGICYVNLSEDFLSQPYNTSADVTVYSITNSLVELSNVNKVQITVNGDTNISYREKISLSSIFERNLDLLAVPEEN